MTTHPTYLIAIQIRMGSTRLPGKMSRAFFADKTIPQLMIEDLLSVFPADRIVVATSNVSEDDAIQDLAERLCVRCSRGSEDDVLRRVVDAVREDEAEFVVRVCGDNPFLRAEYIQNLLTLASEAAREPADYVSYALHDGTPTILSHLGLFAEVVRKTTLLQIEQTATMPRHREHLTSHILDFPDNYSRRFLALPACLEKVPSLRLTVDTEADFQVCQELYAATVAANGKQFSAEQLIDCVEQRPDLQQTMAREVAANEKR